MRPVIQQDKGDGTMWRKRRSFDLGSTRRCTRAVPSALALLAGLWTGAPALAGGSEDLAQRLLSQEGVRPGLYVHVGCADAALTLALARDARCLVHGISTSEQEVRAARQAIQAARKYGPVSVDRASMSRLPYASNIVNVLVADDFSARQREGLTVAEVVRVLAPYGAAFLKGGPAEVDGVATVRVDGDWVRLDEPYPTGAAEFPDSRARTSEDRLVAPPSTLKWITGDYWPVTDSWDDLSMATAGGRVFYRYGQIIEYGVANHEKLDRLQARDAFNGLLLWERLLPTDGRAVLRAHGPWVVLGSRAFDAATGREIDQDVRGKAGYEIPRVIDGKRVFASGNPMFAVDPKTGGKVWQVSLSASNRIVGDDRIFLDVRRGRGREERDIVCLSLRTGERLWTAPRKGRPAAYAEGVLYVSWQKGFSQGGLATGFRKDDLSKGGNAAYSAADGTLLWEYEYFLPGHGGRPDIWPMDGLAWIHAGDAEKGVARGETWRGLDPKTGKVIKTIAMDDTVKHRCSPHMATPRYILTGGMDLFSPRDGKVFGFYGARNACSFGYMPGNGMLYSSATVCECFPHLRGTTAVAAEPMASWEEMRRRAGPEFIQGPAYGKPGTIRPAETDWPTYRHDALRSGVTQVKVPRDLQPVWAARPGQRISSPTIAGGMVFLSVVDEHRVTALDAETGQPRWSHTVGGRVDTPPTVAQGFAVFGARDGWVYCLLADTGELAWKYRAAPEDKRIVCRGQLESAWEVFGTVLVMGGIAYVSAGRHSEVDGGIFLHALDLPTGRVAWRRQIQRAHLLQQASRLNIGNEMNDILSGRDEVLFMHRQAFSTADGSPVAAPGPRLFGGQPGWIADTARPPLGWKHDFQQERAAYFPGEDRAAVRGTIINLAHRKAFVLDKDTHEIVCSLGKGKRLWSVSAAGESQQKALLVTPDTVFVAAVANASDLGKGEVWIYDADTGESVGKVSLTGAPAFEGIAAAAGRLFVTTQDGAIICLGRNGADAGAAGGAF